MTKFTDEFIRDTVRRLIHYKRALHSAELEFEGLKSRTEYVLARKIDRESIAKVYDWLESEESHLDDAKDDYEVAVDMWKEMIAGIEEENMKAGNHGAKNRWAVLEIIDDYSAWGNSMPNYYDTKEQAIKAAESVIESAVWDRFDSYTSSGWTVERPLTAIVSYSLVREDGQEYHAGDYVAARAAEQLADAEEEELEP